MNQYYSLITSYGEKVIAKAVAEQTPISLETMAIGDGNGRTTTPQSNQVRLVNEVYRADITDLMQDSQNSNQIIAELLIPETVGGFTVREIGIFDEQNKLIAVANCPENYKPILEEGSGKVQYYRIVLRVSSSDAVTLSLNNNIIYATRTEFNQFVTKLSEPDGFKYIGECESIAQLRTIEPTADQQRILVKSYYAGKNIGGGVFYAVFADNTTVDDGGTAIVTRKSKRWKRIIQDNSVFVEWFGVTEENAADGINRALRYARNRTGTKICCLGNYYNIKNHLAIWANTHIDFNNATLNKDFIRDPNNGAQGLIGMRFDVGNENVVIENAKVLMNGHLLKNNNQEGGANFFGTSNVKNLIIRNIEVRDIKNVHAIDLANYQNVLIENCRFLGAYAEDTEPVKTRHYSEAIQLESQTQGSNHAELGSIAVVRNCYFGASNNCPSWMSGVGNHGGYDRALAPHKVLVEGCFFEGMSYAGVRTFGAWKEVKVVNNTFDGISGAGFVATNRDAWVDHKGSVSNLILSGNSFNNHTGYACISFLRNLNNSGGNNNAGENALADNIVISDNVMESTRSALYLQGINNAVISGNVSRGADFINGIEIQNTVISNNVIDVTVSGKTGIWIRDGQNDSTKFSLGNKNISIFGNSIKGGRRAIHLQSIHGVAVNNNTLSSRKLNESDNPKNVPMIAIDSGSTLISVNNNFYDSNNDGVDYDNCYLGIAVYYSDRFTCVSNNLLAGMRCHVSGTENKGQTIIIAKGEPNGIVTAPNNAKYLDLDSGLSYIRRHQQNGAGGWILLDSLVTETRFREILGNLEKDIHINKPDTSSASIRFSNSVRSANLNISSSGNFGVWDYKTGKWMWWGDLDGIMRLGTLPELTANDSEIITARWFNNKFTQSLSQNGWEKMPSGRIMQWGVFNAENGNTFNFPIAFNQVFNVYCTDENAGGDSVVAITVTNKTNTSFSIKSTGNTG